MAYPNSVIVVNANGLISGENTQLRLVYANDNSQANASSSAACDAFYNQVWDVWKDAVHVGFLLKTIEASIYQIPTSGNKPSYMKFVNEQGALTSTDCLPPYVTVGLVKMPNNTTKEPSSVDDFRRGYARFAGIPEGHQVAGLLTSGAVTLWDAVGEAMEELSIDFGSGAVVYTLMIDRYQAGGSNPMCEVAEMVTPYKTGSQNTRKF